jgi:hypothetical protein
MRTTKARVAPVGLSGARKNSPSPSTSYHQPHMRARTFHEHSDAGCLLRQSRYQLGASLDLDGRAGKIVAERLVLTAEMIGEECLGDGREGQTIFRPHETVPLVRERQIRRRNVPGERHRHSRLQQVGRQRIRDPLGNCVYSAILQDWQICTNPPCRRLIWPAGVTPETGGPERLRHDSSRRSSPFKAMSKPAE